MSRRRFGISVAKLASRRRQTYYATQTLAKKRSELGLTSDTSKYKPEFAPLEPSNDYVRETPQYPSNTAAGGSTSSQERDYSLDGNFVVGQAYNKGNLVVLTKDEAGDSRTGKRR